MSRMIRMDEEAFNRGVNEVLRMKPLRRALSNVVKLHAKPATASSKNPKGAPRGRGTNAGKSTRKHG